MPSDYITKNYWNPSVSPMGLRVGDLARWKAHEDWDDGGLGTVVEIRSAFDSVEYRIMWHGEMEDRMDYKGSWYSIDDLEDGIERA